MLQEATFVFEDNDCHPRVKWLKNVTKSIIDCLKFDLDPQTHQILEDKLTSFIKNDLRNYVNPSTKYQNTITHADLWKNNILFGIDNDNIESKLIDFQLIRYAPPAFDILTTIYLNATYDFLHQNMKNLIKTYYYYLHRYLESHNINLESIYPFQIFMKSIGDYKKCGILEATMFGTIVFISKELSEQICSSDQLFNEFTLQNRSKYVCEEYSNNSHFKERFGTLLKMLVEQFLED